MDSLTALPLIPIEQMLARGIALGLNLGVPLGLLAFALALQHAGLDWTLGRLAQSRPLPIARVVIIALGLAFLWIVATTPLIYLAKLGVGAALSVVVGVLIHPHLTGFTRHLVLTSAMLIGFVLSGAYLTPDPLPTVSLRLTNGRTVSGRLIAQRGQDWVLGTGGAARIHETGEVVSSRIYPTRSHISRTTLWDAVRP